MFTVNSLCMKEVGSYNHILLWCLMVYDIQFMVYNLLGITWVIACTIKDELQTWSGICEKSKTIKFISLTIFWLVCKDINNRAFDGYVEDMTKIRDRWFNVFGSLILEHDLDGWDDFEKVIDVLTKM